MGRSSAMKCKISWNMCRGMATSAIWKAMVRPWLMTLITSSFETHRVSISFDILNHMRRARSQLM